MEIFTIGYEGRTIKDFVQCLLRWKVNIVADVRLNPLSRKPFFSKTSNYLENQINFRLRKPIC